MRHARGAGLNVGEHIAALLDQVEMFGGGATVSPETEAFLRP